MKVYIPSHNGSRKCIMIVDSSELTPSTGVSNKYVIHSEYYDYIYDGNAIFTSIEAVQKFWRGEQISQSEVYNG